MLCSEFGGPEVKSVFVGLEKGNPCTVSVKGPSPEKGREILAGLLEHYWTGLSAPVPFFPETSLRYAQEVLVKGKSAPEALRAALRVWEGSDYQGGERDDVYVKQCFGRVNPLDDSFQATALAVWGPLFACLG